MRFPPYTQNSFDWTLGKAPFGALLWTGMSLLLGSCGLPSGNALPPSLPPSKAPPQIFDAYHEDRNVKLAEGWTRGMDMSGVSFNLSRTATLITPRHVVMAKHFARWPLSPVVLHNRKGKRLERRIMQIAAAQGDVMVGLLDEPVPSNYTSYPLPDSGSNPTALVGKPVIVSDQKQCLFVHTIAAVGGGRIQFKHDPTNRYGWGKKLVVGDSGNPSFVISGKELVLVETHTTGGPGAGPYYGDPAIQAGLRAAVAKLDDNYQIRTVRLTGP